MKRLWLMLGTLVFWASWPLLWIYLRIGSRTRLLIIAEGKVLVVRGWMGTKQWILPGGGLHRGEAPKTGGLRELREETGIRLQPEQLTQLYSTVAHQQGLRFKYVCFVAELPKITEVKHQFFEIIDSAWLPLETITKKDVTADTYKAVQTWLAR